MFYPYGWEDSPPRRFAAGMTLIEILVVIGIVAVLVALIGPTLSRLTLSAQEAKCASNLRGLIPLLHTYVADHNGDLPWTVYSDPEGPSGTTHPVAALIPYVDEAGASRLLQCPGYQNWKHYPGLGTPESPMQAHITGWGTGKNDSIRNSYNWRGFSTVGGKPYTFMRMGRITQPSKEWYICDRALGSKSDPQPKVIPSHGNKGGYVAYIDGHVAWVPAEEWNHANYLSAPKTPGDLPPY